jgi:exopolysaccharide production protein ExoY
LREVASKTVSDLSKLSANMTAFDLPVHERGQVSTAHEPVRARRRVGNRPAETPGLSRRATATDGQRALATQAEFSALIRASSANGATPTAGTLWMPDGVRSEPIGGPVKRLLDIVLAGTMLVLLSPLLLAIALMIYLTMGRPIFFPQRRLGFAGRSFACLKFRTMVNDADGVLRSHLASNHDAASEWRVRQKLKDDPRVTTMGHVLRRSSLDELPQLLSVLRGDMSCVGPRPIVHDEVTRYGRYWKHYIQARPGLTGAWQVSGRNRLSYRRRVALDSHYVRKWSILRDIGILVRTIPAVLRSDTT